MQSNPNDVKQAVSSPVAQPSQPSHQDETAPLMQPGALPAFGPPVEAGEVGKLGKYRLIRLLGRGGMGAVVLAFDEKLHRNVALKIMLPGAAAIPGARERFLREARAAARVHSDHVVAIYEADEIDGTPYLALQLLKGMPLDQFLVQKGDPPLAQAVRIARETALGLEAAHKLGVIHRDIKPGNLWLEAPAGRVKILDFGLAKPVEGMENAELTAAGVIVGTPAYMPPEQGLGKPVDARTDLYSLGCVLYRMVTGKTPFSGATKMAVLAAVLTDAPRPVREINPKVPEALANLIHRLLAKSPAERPASAREVAEELTRIAQQLAPKPATATTAAAASPVVQSAPTLAEPNPFADIHQSAEAVVVPPPLKPAPSKAPPRPRVLIAASLAGLLGLILGGFILLKITHKDGSVTELKVPAGSKVEVVKDGKATVVVPGTKDKPAQAKVEPPKVDPLSPWAGIDFAAERRAAEAMAKIPGVALELLKDDGSAMWVRDGKLPDEPFAVYGIEAVVGKALDDAALAPLAGCRVLTWLDVRETPITDAGLKHLSHLRTLRTLRVEGCMELGDEIGEILRHSPDLHTIGMNMTRATAKTVAALQACPHVRLLYLPERLTEADLASVVKHCPRIEDLLIQLEIAGEGAMISLAPLAGLRHLRKLNCDGSQLTPEAIALLAKLPRFEALEIGTPTTEAVTRLKPLAGKLKGLFVYSNLHRDKGLTAAGHEVIAGLTALEWLRLTPNDGLVTDADLTRLAKLPKLRELQLVQAGHVKPKPAHTAAGVAAFRRQRPDVHLHINFDGKKEDYPAYADWPGKADGLVGIAPWALPKDAPPPAIVPFSPEQARQHQEAWAKHLKKPVEVESKATGMKLRLIPPGEFETTLDGKAALLRVTKPYYLGTTEVTVGQFKKFVEATGYKTEAERLGVGRNKDRGWVADPAITWRTPGYPIMDDLPVTVISVEDASAFLKWLGTQDGAVYRLPTQAEWEASSLAGSTGEFAFLDKPESVGEYAWGGENVEGKPTPVQPVGTRKANPFGLFDVLGNVWEWYYPELGSTGILGGSFVEGLRDLRVRINIRGSIHINPNVGFRVLRQTTNDPFVVPKPYRLDGPPVMVAKGQPLAPHATVSRPAAIAGVRSWSVELAGHVGNVQSIAWSPKGDVIATGGYNDLGVRLWDRDGNLKRVLLGHEGQVNSVAFSPDGSLLASADFVTGGSRHTLRLWDVASGTCKAVVPLPLWGPRVAFSPDGRHLAVASNVGISLLDLKDDSLRQLTSGIGDIHALGWSPDGTQLLLATGGESLLTYDVKTGQKAAEFAVPDWAEGKHKGLGAAAWSPDGQWVAGGGADGKLRIWNAKTREHVRTVETQVVNITCVAWHPESKVVAVSGSGGGKNWQTFDAKTGRLVASGPNVGGEVLSVAWSPEGKELALYYTVTNGRGTPVIYDPLTGQILRQGKEHRVWNFGEAGTYYRFTSELHAGEFLRKPFELKTLRRFDLETGQLRGESPAPAHTGFLLAPAGQWRAFLGGGECRIEPTKEAPVRFVVPQATRWYGWYQAHPSGDRLAGMFGKQVIVWDTATGNQRYVLEHPAEVNLSPGAQAWSPDGRQILTAATDKVLRLWDADTGKLLRAFDRFPQPPGGMYNGVSLVWEAEGREVWVSFGEQAARLDVKTGRVSPLENFSNGNLIESFALAPDGDRLLVREGYGWNFLRERDGSRRTLGQWLGVRPMWLPDGRRFLGEEYALGYRGFDVDRNERLGTLWPAINDRHWVCIGPDGHYRGSEGIEEHLVVVALLEDGSQQTFTPKAFAEKFGWKNDPSKARLLKLAP